MHYQLDHGAHSVYSLLYHFICVVKYRRDIFTLPEIVNFLKQLNRKIAQKYDIEIQEQETDRDHIHFLFKAKPTANLVKFIHHLKGSTSFVLFRKFPEIKQYIENQGKK